MPHPDDDSQYLVPIAEASTRWNIPERTLRHYVERGILPAHRLGPRKIRIDLRDIGALCRPMPKASRWLTSEDEELAREVARALLPLTEEQKEKLALLLHPGARRGAA